MALEEIASGSSIWQIGQLNSYDQYFQEGDTQRLRLEFAVPVAASLAGQVGSYLSQQGITEWYEVQVDGRVAWFTCRIGNPFPWAILGAFIAGIGAVMLSNWALYRVIPEQARMGVLPLVLAGAAVVVAALVLTE